MESGSIMVQMTPKEKANLALQGISRPKPPEPANDALSKAKQTLSAIKIKQTELKPPPEVISTNISPFTGRALPPSRADKARAVGFEESQEGGTATQRLAGSLGDTKDVQNALSAGTEFKPEDFEVTNLEGIGIIFKGPNDEKFQILDPTGFDAGDIASSAPDVLTTAAEGGAIVATKSPIAGAIAGATTRAALLQALKFAGVLEDPDIIADALIEGGFSLAGAKAPGAGKAVKKFLSPEKRALESIQKTAPTEAFEQGAKQVGDVAAEVERVGGVKPEFTVAEELSSVEPERAAKLAGAESAAGGLIESTRSQRLATEGLKARLSEGASEGVEEVGETIATKQEARITAAISQVEKNTAEATKRANAKINKITGNTSPEEIRSVLDEGVEKVRTSIKSSYEDVAAQARDADFDLTEVSNLSKDMLEKVRIGETGKAIFKDSEKFTKDFNTAIKEGTGLDAYRTLQEARSEVRAHIRSLKDSKASGAQLNEAVQLEKEITGTINDALNKLDPNLAEQLANTDMAFAKFTNDVEKGLVGGLLAKKGGQRKIPSENIVKTILGNSSNTKAFLQTAEDFPEINGRSQLRDAFFTGYENKVINGKMTHDTYMKQVENTKEMIFTKAEVRSLDNAGSAQTQIKNIQKRKDDRVKTINKTFNAKLSRFEPTELVKKVSKSQRDTAKLKKIVSPQEWLDYQAARRSKAVRDMTNSKGELTLSGVDKVLEANKGELTLALGEEYVKDLGTARDFLTILAKKQSGIGAAREAAEGITELDVAKAMLFGPLSHTGFVMGRLKGFGKKRTANAMVKLLNDPVLLRERIRINNLPPDKQLEQLQQLFGGLGLPLALNRGTDIKEVKEVPQ